jgi:hypothetical protein
MQLVLVAQCNDLTQLPFVVLKDVSMAVALDRLPAPYSIRHILSRSVCTKNHARCKVVHFRNEPKCFFRDMHNHTREVEEKYMICGTHMLYMGSPEREEASLFCFIALRKTKMLPRATSRT